ncbi:MAG: oligoendopeptidase F [Firmicutes bacterium]|nr:oligoendopeptidase F [Bacillota bacterium]MDY4817042.1 oligoendopeptidase F [Lachnospiraceae bacterium]
MEVKDRKDIDVKDTWNLESIYANNELWEEDYAALEKDAAEFAKLKGAIEADVSKIPAVLDAYYGLHRRLSKLSVYARMRFDQDTTDSTYQTMSAKIGSLGVKIGAASAFVEPEILSYSKEQLEAAEKENERIAYYGRKIEEMLRGQEHTLDAEKEELLAAAGDMAEAPDDIFSVLMNADMKYPDIVLEDGTHLPLTNSTYISYMESPDRAVREGAFKTLYGQIASLKNTFAAIYRGNLKQAKFYAQSRKYSSARAMYLADSNVPESVYDNLLSAVHEALPMMYRYVAVRKKVLGVDKLHMYDVYTPIVAAQNQTYEFEQAKQMVLEALKPMGEDYLSHAREGLENRWIDIYPNKGKKGGAYSWGCYDSQPFILLNYTKNLDSVFTLIHEMGHSIHSYYSRTAQDYAYSDYKIFVAEVASTCNECLLMHDLLEKTTDKEQRKYLLNHYLDSFKGTLFRQTMFAEFEKTAHDYCAQGKPLTAEALSQMYLELNQKYFGPDMEKDEEIAYEWMRIPHFYTPFYVYQYATGYSAAVALSAKILKEGKPAVDAYMSFLKGGESKDPIDLLKMAGVDMTTEKPVADALALFGELVAELEALV